MGDTKNARALVQQMAADRARDRDCKEQAQQALTAMLTGSLGRCSIPSHIGDSNDGSSDDSRSPWQPMHCWERMAAAVQDQERKAQRG